MACLTSGGLDASQIDVPTQRARVDGRSGLFPVLPASLVLWQGPGTQGLSIFLTKLDF